jgi:hypothetical protein
MLASLVFDRAGSVRHLDADGRLHIAVATVSKANVCRYLGHEIPGYQALGLDAAKAYRVFRDPDELAKAVDTFNGLPVLDRHVAVDSVQNHSECIVGSLGNDAAFDGEILTNSLVIWSQPAIDALEDGSKPSLSAGYRYTPLRQSGAHRGEPYDLVMRDIIGNHIATVSEGRIGPAAVIGDSALPNPRIARPQSDDIIRRRYWGSYAF